MKVNIRRGVIAAGALATIAALALSGCSGSSSSDSKSNGSAANSKSLTVWVDADRASVLKDVAADYEKTSGVKVNLVQKDFGKMENDLIQQVPTGKGPDIAIGANDWTGQLVTDGVIQPVELGDAASDYQKVATDAFTYDGKLYALPYSIENLALLRNTKLAPTAPTSWADMVSTGQKAGTEFPFLIQVGDAGDPYTMYPVQSSFGSSVFAKNSDGSYDASKLTIGDAGGTQFADWLAQQGKSGLIKTSVTGDIAISKFNAGASPYFLTGPWNVASAQKAGIDLAIDPIPSAGGQTAAPFVGVQGFFISAKTKNEVAANDFLLHTIGTEAVQTALYKVGYRPPALTSAFNAAQSDPIMKGFAEVSKSASPMPNVPAMAAVWQYWGATESAIISGKGDPKQLWTKMTSDIQAAIDKK